MKKRFLRLMAILGFVPFFALVLVCYIPYWVVTGKHLFDEWLAPYTNFIYTHRKETEWRCGIPRFENPPPPPPSSEAQALILRKIKADAELAEVRVCAAKQHRERNSKVGKPTTDTVPPKKSFRVN